MKFKPNTKLPKGARLLSKVRTEKAGSWSESLRYDATVERIGLVWLRVKGGFGEKPDNNREDWVADLTSGCLSVSDYNWNKGSFGHYYGSFDDSIIGETERHIEFVELEMKKKIATLKALQKTAKLVRLALKQK